MKYCVKLLLVSMLILGILFSSCICYATVGSNISGWLEDNVAYNQAAMAANDTAVLYGNSSEDTNTDRDSSNSTGNSRGSSTSNVVSGKLNDYGIGGEGSGIDESLISKTNAVLGAIQLAGYITAVIIIVYVGVKYIISSGDEKADMKTAIPKYVMGALLVIFCDVLTGFIFTVLE